MIYVLTRDTRLKSQLSLLLRDIGFSATFHSDVGELISTIRRESGETDSVLFDLSLPGADVFAELSAAQLQLRLIGFEVFDGSLQTEAPAKPAGLDHFLLLPPHAERAKVRLKNALRAGVATGAIRKPGTRIGMSLFKRPAASPTKFPAGFGLNNTKTEAPPARSRYMEATAPASAAFVRELSELKTFTPLSLLCGNTGAEFELAARELNFQINGDQPQLILLEPDSLRIDELEKLEKDASRKAQTRCCYLGKTEDLTEESAQNLQLFIEFLENLRTPRLRLLLAHEHETKPFFRAGVEPIFHTLQKKYRALEIPDLSTRPEDIRWISLSLLSTLRNAHPFLQVRSISDEAIHYLVENRSELSQQKLVRILRNAIALSSRTELGVEDILNYGEHNTSTSHLVESMADERFFPQDIAIAL